MQRLLHINLVIYFCLWLNLVNGVVLSFFLLTLNLFQTFFWCSINDFEQVNGSSVIYLLCQNEIVGVHNTKNEKKLLKLGSH